MATEQERKEAQEAKELAEALATKEAAIKAMEVKATSELVNRTVAWTDIVIKFRKAGGAVKAVEVMTGILSKDLDTFHAITSVFDTAERLARPKVGAVKGGTKAGPIDYSKIV